MRYLDSRPRVRVRTDLLGIVRIVHFLSLEGPFLTSKASFDTKIPLESLEASHGISNDEITPISTLQCDQSKALDAAKVIFTLAFPPSRY